MTVTEELIYKHVASHIYKEADVVSVADKKAVRAITIIADGLTELYDKKYANGFMLEISLWMGLKEDAPDMAKNYGKGMKEIQPEIFESDRVTRKRYGPKPSNQNIN